MQVKLATENIRAIALFEKVTDVHVKDCIISPHSLYFLVSHDSMGAAIGKNGENIRRLRKLSGRHVKIFAYSSSPEEFIRNIIPTVRSVNIENGSATVSVPQEDKLTVIGKGGENINAIRDIMKRHFNITVFKLR